MTQPVLHVVFTPSGAGSLKQALQHADRDDGVISFFDNLSFGPINPPDPSLRAKWVESELGWTEWNDVTAGSDRFWREALSSRHRKIAWLSRRSAMEYAGFLEWLQRLEDDPCEIIDLTDVRVFRQPRHWPPIPAHLAVSLGVLSSRKMPTTICSARQKLCPQQNDVIIKLSGDNFGQRVRRSVVSKTTHWCPRTFVFRYAVNVLCDGRLAKGGDGCWPGIGCPNGRFYLPNWRSFAGGSRQRPGRERPARDSGQVRARDAVQPGKVAEGAALTRIPG